MMKQRILKTTLLMVLAILLSNILLPIAYALAADGIKTTLDISYGNIVIGNDTVVGYSETGKLVETVDSDGYIITGSTTTNTITVADGTHNFIFSGVSIDVNITTSACAFSIQTGAVVNLSLSGTNELISGANCAGLQVPSGASVTISGSGSLSAKGGRYGAGIGGGIGQSGGSITINGGTVTAIGGEGGAGIGGGGRSAASSNGWNPGGTGGAGGSGGSITINDGTVTATGGERGAGIGGGGGGVGGGGSPAGAGGAGGSGGSITISGGTVTATGGDRGAGIGGGGGANGGYGNYDYGGNGGAAGSGGIITISTADITAIGKYSGAGIGSGGYGGGGGTSSSVRSGGERGSGSAGGVITISHATVEAQGGDYSAGIGGGAGGSGGEITITSTTVNALSSSTGAGIGGGGMNGSGGTIIINSSDVTVESINGAGIGGGSGGSSGEITITNATVDALSSSTGAGIGGGNGGSGDIITIDGGGVTAQSQSGAGIGGGASGNSGEITITNATIDALSSSTGAGIGGGNGGSGDIITIDSGHVIAQSQTGAGIGGGSGGGSGGTITINSGDITANSIYGAGIGGGSGGGSGGTITINSGDVTADSIYGAGIGGGIGNNGGNGGSVSGARNGGNGGNGGTITISGGIVTVPGENYVKINGGSGGSGGSGGIGTAGGSGGNGGNGGGGDVIITGGTILPSGSGTNNGIGGAKGGNGGKGGDGPGYPETRPSGSAGATGVLSSCVVTGGSVKANIGCTPTTGGETPVNVYYTVTRLGGAGNVSVFSLSQGGTISYGIKDMRTDANGWLYLYLPAYEGSTTTAITAGSTSYTGYNGLIRATATFSSPNVLKINQTPPLTYKNPASKEFNYGETVSFTPDEIAVEGGLLTEGTVTYTYSGTERGTGVIVTDRTTAPVNAGSYSLNATLPGNDYYHDAVAAKSFVINPKSIAGFTAEDISDKIYSGAAQTPAVTVKDGSTTLVSPRDFSVNYSGNTNVGTATADISGQNNYTGTLKKTFQIVPKEIALTLSAVPAAAMVGSDVALTATVSGAVDLPAGTVTFKYGDTLIAENVPIVDDGSYRATATWSSVPAGKYDLTATYNAATYDNYTCVSNGLISDFSILKYNQSGYAFADGTDYAIVDGVVHKTYGDSVFTLQTVDKLSTGDETFTVTSGSDVVTIDEITGSVTLLKSGTAVISVLSPSDATYNEASATLTISVAKAAQSGFSFADSTIAKTYGDALFTVPATGGQSTGGVTYAVTAGSDVASVDADSGEVTIHKSGTAVITANRAEDDRYLEATADLIITVAKASQNGFGFADSTLTKTFSNMPFAIAATGGQGSGAVTYEVTAGSDVVAVNARSGAVTMLKAGTAVITAKRAMDDRYLSANAQLTITVAKAMQNGFGFADESASRPYGDAPFSVTATGGQGSGAITYEVTVGSDVVAVDADSGEVTMLKTGTAVITATRATDDRYHPTTAQITITVAKAAQSGFGFAGSRVAKTYGDAAFTVSATGGQSTGVVTYAVTSGRSVVSVNSATGRVAIQKAGTAVITATRAEDDRYNAATQTITIIVDKAQTIVTALPLAADIEVIGKLSTSALSGGAGSVPGHFSWADPDQIVSASGKYQAIFTPEDMGNYMPSTCDVQVNVMPVLVHPSTGIQFDLSQASVPSGVTSVNVSLAQIETDEGNISMDDITDLVNTDEKFSGIVLAVYDLALIDQSGQPITGFTGTITVRVPVPDGMSGDLRVFWFDTETETMTDMNARLEDGWLVFETTHFSYYAIVQMTTLSPPATVTTTTSADAGANTLLIVVLILAGVAVIGGLAVYLTIRKNERHRRLRAE